jgi:hypothetical protein
MSNVNADAKRELLRHALATVAYRGGKAIRNAPEGFAVFHSHEGVRSPGRILAHMGDLMEWSLSMAAGKQAWHDSKPLPWDKEVERFFEGLKKFDDYLASNEPVQASPEKLLQGPIADALTHVGQLAMLRRMAGDSMKSENYFDAEIASGRVGTDQVKPKQEF